MNEQELILVRDASVSFGNVQALKHASISVPAGTILGLIGPSGSGKTTLIRLITGQMSPTTGEVRVFGTEPRKFNSRQRARIGYMPQQFVLYPDLTASENLHFVASLFGMFYFTQQKRVREALELVSLYDVRNRKASELSGGMQRRLELACALVHQPTILVVDEPTAGLDPLLRQEVWNEFRRLRDAGRTLLVSTQYVGEAEFCDAVALIVDGELIAVNTPDQLRQSAFGGEMLEVETARPVDVRDLRPIPGITVRQTGIRSLVFTAPSIGEATPQILKDLSDQQISVQSSKEFRPSFDDVFTELVSTRQALNAA